MTSGSSQQAPDRNLAMELVRVTEAAALAAARWMGRGDKEGADGAAVDAMRVVLQGVPMDGIVVIGEGEKDEAPMLYNGERVGDLTPPLADVAVDPIDGTTLTALGRGNALAVIAVSERGTMFDPGPCVYMEKIAVGPEAAGVIDINRSPSANIEAVARAKGESVRDVTVVILDRPRHEALIAEVRATGARIRLIPDGDVAGAISTAWRESGADLLLGVGGTPEGVIAAAALKCMGGELQGKLWPRNDSRARRRAGPRLRPRCRAQHRHPGAGRQLLLRGDRDHRRRASAGRPLRLPGGDDAVTGDAVEVRDGAADRRPSPAQQAESVLLDPLRVARPHAEVREKWLRAA